MDIGVGIGIAQLVLNFWGWPPQRRSCDACVITFPNKLADFIWRQFSIFLMCSGGLSQVLTLEPILDVSQSDSTMKTVPSVLRFSAVKSPTSALASNMSSALSLQSPLTRAGEKNDKKLKQALHLHPSRNGLNSILDGSPSDFPSTLGASAGKKKIKRQSLRSFYGNSVNSPNLTEVPSCAIVVRRSPRRNGIIKQFGEMLVK